MKIIFLIAIIFFALTGLSQINEFHFIAGMNYGGPLPQHKVQGSTGTPMPGFNAGARFSKRISEKLSLDPELFLSYKAIKYSSSYTRDTIVSISIMGTSGEVPSYYTAYVNGKMNFFYLELPFLFSYRLKRSLIMFGPYVSQIIKGKDTGNVRVMIGDGGFYDDYYEDYNNNSSINKTEYGVIAGSTLPLFSRLMLEFKVSRSFRPFYKSGFFSRNGNPEAKLFSTYIYFSLGYKIGK